MTAPERAKPPPAGAFVFPASPAQRRLWFLDRLVPGQAFYTPSITLAECRTFANFDYVPGVYVDHFRIDGGGRINSVVASRADGKTQEFAASSVVLAAGTLSSAKIFLESIYRDSGKVPELRGLMDNRQILMPFVNLRMIGKQWEPASYQ